MAKLKKKSDAPGSAVYQGRQTKTGNSLGLRFDKALFQSHPEFNGTVQAQVIAPGRMLVVAQTATKVKNNNDPVIASFLSFLAKDMERNPDRIISLDKQLVGRIERLVKGMQVDANEDLGADALL